MISDLQVNKNKMLCLSVTHRYYCVFLGFLFRDIRILVSVNNTPYIPVKCRLQLRFKVVPSGVDIARSDSACDVMFAGRRLIEEFMLMANMAVAHRIYKSFPALAVLRRHPPPQEKLIDGLVSDTCNALVTLDETHQHRRNSSMGW